MVTVDAHEETFARLLVRSADDLDDRYDKVEMAADWRSHPPVTLDIGRFCIRTTPSPTRWPHCTDVRLHGISSMSTRS